VSGRLINTTSGAGLQGSIGQSNYAAAKAGIAALTLNQAAELCRYGITANAICPVARTGMTTAVPAMAERMAAPDDGSFDHFAPENVSSVVTWLCSEQSGNVTGQIIEAEGGRIAIADGWRSTEGVDKGSRWTPADVGAALEEAMASAVPPQQVWGT
jgi:NAD(P)-dependent dehydrogenase (short-subunit alcohol dehydrogenase family)